MRFLLFLFAHFDSRGYHYQQANGLEIRLELNNRVLPHEAQKANNILKSFNLSKLILIYNIKKVEYIFKSKLI